MYIQQTEFEGYGVFKYGQLISEFATESEAYAYLILLMQGKGEPV